MGVIMEARFKIEPKIKRDDYIRLSLDSFEFQIGDKDIPFDFEDYRIAIGDSQEDGTVLVYTTGDRHFGEYELADYYHEEWNELGLTKKDITAEYLAQVSNINLIEYECYTSEEMQRLEESLPIKLISISFEDIETHKVYNVDQKVIDSFNREQ